MDESHITVAVISVIGTTIVNFVVAWTKRRADLVAISKGEFDNDKSGFKFLRGEWEKSFRVREELWEKRIEDYEAVNKEERSGREKALERIDKLEASNMALRDQLAQAMTDLLLCKAEIQTMKAQLWNPKNTDS